MEKNKTHWKKVFNKDYLGACDLEDGKDLKAVIKSVEIREIKDPQGKKSNRNVALFTDAKIKPMILNVTNCKVVKKFSGSNFIEEWKNIPVQIYSRNDIEAFGSLTEGLRFRDTQPQMNKPELKPGTQAWDGAKKFLTDTGTIPKIKEKYSLSKENEEKLKEEVLV